MGVRLSRRLFLTSVAAGLRAASDRGQLLPADWRRYPDPATEFEVLRLTDPKYTSRLPAYYGRAVSQRGGFLLFCSDRTGSMQAYRIDLKSGQTRQLTDAEALDPASPTLMPDERSFLYLDAGTVRQVVFSSLREREIYSVPEGFERGEGFSVAEDGVHAVLVEKKSGGCRVRLIGTARGTATTVAESDEPISAPIPRPRRAGILYRRGEDGLWLVNYDGQQNRRLKLAPGGLGPAMWSADGKTVLYLNVPEDRTRLNSLRESTPDTNADQLVSPTSQFVHFDANRDSSVFVGASGSKASPHVLLLLRVTHRELTLCEHKASDPRMVSPIFSPNSQRVYFTSDRHGKPAIYSMAVDRFVEKTES